MRVLVFLDGAVADPDIPQVRVDDHGLMRGDGVFETVLVRDGLPRELGPHLDRLRRSAAMLDLPEQDVERWRRTVDDVLARWPEDREMVLKLVCTRGSEPDGEPLAFALGIDVDDKIKQARATGIAAVTLDRGFDDGLAERAPWLLLGAKSLSYAVNMAAIREANRRGADDAIFLAADGAVLEGPTSTVVVVRDRTLYTPPPTIGILPGTSQAALFRAAQRAGWHTKVEPLRVDDLRTADGLLLTSSIREITRVHTLDGERLPDARELHAELVAAYETEYRV